MKTVAILAALVWVAAAGLSAQSAATAPPAPTSRPAPAVNPVAQHRAMLKQYLRGLPQHPQPAAVVGAGESRDRQSR